MLPKRPAAADEVFPHPRLRLVDAERHRLAGRQAELVGPQALLVDAVPRFVHRAEQRAGEEIFVVARRESHVARAVGATERMVRDVEPARVEIETDRRRDSRAEFFLGIDRTTAAQHVQVRLPSALDDRRHQRHQLLAQLGQHLPHFGRLRAGFELVQQRVVRHIFVTERRRFLLLELDRLFQERLKPREVVRLARFGPDLLPEHRRAGQLFDQRLRQLRLLIVVALEIVDHRAGVAVPIGRQRAFEQLGQILADDRVRLPPMHEPGQIADLLGPIFAAGRRHLRPLVPLQERLRRAQERDFARMGAELVESRGVFRRRGGHAE